MAVRSKLRHHRIFGRIITTTPSSLRTYILYYCEARPTELKVHLRSLNVVGIRLIDSV